MSPKPFKYCLVTLDIILIFRYQNIKSFANYGEHYRDVLAMITIRAMPMIMMAFCFDVKLIA